MNIFTRLYYRYRRILKAIQLFLLISGPGIIVMIADNDAGGITTYAATGAKFGYSLIWVIIRSTCLPEICDVVAERDILSRSRKISLPPLVRAGPPLRTINRVTSKETLVLDSLFLPGEADGKEKRKHFDREQRRQCDRCGRVREGRGVSVSLTYSS